jgi:hypothetical protein
MALRAVILVKQVGDIVTVTALAVYVAVFEDLNWGDVRAIR